MLALATLGLGLGLLALALDDEATTVVVIDDGWATWLVGRSAWRARRWRDRGRGWAVPAAIACGVFRFLLGIGLLLTTVARARRGGG